MAACNWMRTKGQNYITDVWCVSPTVKQLAPRTTRATEPHFSVLRQALPSAYTPSDPLSATCCRSVAAPYPLHASSTAVFVKYLLSYENNRVQGTFLFISLFGFVF